MTEFRNEELRLVGDLLPKALLSIEFRFRLNSSSAEKKVSEWFSLDRDTVRLNTAASSRGISDLFSVVDNDVIDSEPAVVIAWNLSNIQIRATVAMSPTQKIKFWQQKFENSACLCNSQWKWLLSNKTIAI